MSSERSDPILWYFMMNNYNCEYENLVFWKQKGPLRATAPALCLKFVSSILWQTEKICS
jgi:hypothetical protein